MNTAVSYVWIVISLFVGFFFSSSGTKLASAAALAWIVISLLIRKSNFLSLPKKAMPFLLAVAAVLSVYLNMNEAIHYDNYIYSRLHLIPERLGIFIGSLFGLFFLSENIRKSFLLSLSLFAVFAFGFARVSEAIGKSAANLAYWSHLPSANAERVTRKMYGEDLKYVEFIRLTLPDTARIVIAPPSFARRHTSDLWIMSSLLYPRRIIQYSSELDIGQADYLLFTAESDSGRVAQFWPDFELAGIRTTLYDWQYDKGMEMSRSDFPGEIANISDAWGFITLHP